MHNIYQLIGFPKSQPKMIQTKLFKPSRASPSILGTYLNAKGLCSSSDFQNVPLPSKARVVICGGGVMGSSVAYHLSELGWGEHTVILEKGSCGGGTKWVSSGLIGSFKPKISQVRLTQETIRLYQSMEERGLKTGWKQCGSLCIARTKDRMTVFRRMKAKSVSWNIDCELLTPDEIKRKCPLLKTDDLAGGLFIPGDGVANSYEICRSFIECARKGGFAKKKKTVPVLSLLLHKSLECDVWSYCMMFGIELRSGSYWSYSISDGGVQLNMCHSANSFMYFCWSFDICGGNGQNRLRIKPIKVFSNSSLIQKVFFN